jgi:MtfA peptidase
VVIHEFAHVLDMAHGGANGVPALPAYLPLALWQSTLGAAYERLVQSSAAVGVSQHAGAIDAYGATAPEEFFAVASESFFVSPLALQAEEAALYAVLAQFYGQDPAQEPAARARCKANQAR